MSSNVHLLFLCLLAEVIDSVIWQRRVRNTVCATKQHLERDIRNQLSHLSESVPWILIKETHSNIESGTAPALKTVEVAISVTSLFRNVQKIDFKNISAVYQDILGEEHTGSDTGSEKRLMSITPSGVHEKATLVLSDSLCESLWAFLDDNVSPSLLTWDTGINLLSGIIEELGHNDIALEFGLTNLTLDA